jgi:hypothetical protein
MTTYALAPIVNGEQWFTDQGVILSGGKINTYLAGGTTPAATYTDSTGVTPNANPIILGSNGRPPQEVWLPQGTAYKFVVTDASNVVLATLDNLSGINDTTALTTFEASLASSSGSSLVGFLASGTGSVLRTGQDKLRDFVSVKDFGAKGDGSTNDTSAIQSAVNASKCVFFPPGTYLYSTINCDGFIGTVLQGSSGISSCILRCTGTGSSAALTFKSSFDCVIRDMTLDHSSASFTGYLLNLGHSTSTDTQGFMAENVTFGSQGFNLYSAQGVNLDKATVCTFTKCKFVSLNRPIDGQSSAGSSYSVNHRFIACQFSDNSGYGLNYLGDGWTLIAPNFEPKHDGSPGVAFSQSTTPFTAFTVIGGWYGDTTATGSFFTLDAGDGFVIHGGRFGGIAGCNLVNATGIIRGLDIRGVHASNFSNLVVAGVTGNVGWGISSNRLASVTTVVNTQSNVSDLRITGNSPSIAQAAITVTASPFTYTNTNGQNAHVLISGGTVSAVEYSKDGATFITIGALGGMWTVYPNDRIRVTYTVAPTMTVIPA